MENWLHTALKVRLGVLSSLKVNKKKSEQIRVRTLVVINNHVVRSIENFIIVGNDLKFLNKRFQ